MAFNSLPRKTNTTPMGGGGLFANAVPEAAGIVSAKRLSAAAATHHRLSLIKEADHQWNN
jgi:hypothetical protein